MANQMRWRYGDTNPVMLQVLSETVIEIGDFVAYLPGREIFPANKGDDQGDLDSNQEELTNDFAGVAMQASAAGSVEPIRVATTGVFEYETDAATARVGDFLGGAADPNGILVDNQKLVKVLTINLAIGRCAKHVDPAGTSILIDIVSTLTRGGLQKLVG